jgi:hypothetical protein
LCEKHFNKKKLTLQIFKNLFNLLLLKILLGSFNLGQFSTIPEKKKKKKKKKKLVFYHSFRADSNFQKKTCRIVIFPNALTHYTTVFRCCLLLPQLLRLQFPMLLLLRVRVWWAGRQAGRKGGRVLPSQSRSFALLYTRLE